MTNCKITILPANKRVTVPKGTVLLQAIQQAGVHIESACGGQGVCGQCRVKIEEGRYNTETTTQLSGQECAQGMCLACLTLVEGDLTVSIPRLADWEKAQILEGEGGVTLELGHWQINPALKKVHLKLPPPSLDDNLSDYERLRRELHRRGFPDRHLHCELPFLQKLGQVARQHHWEVTVTLIQSDTVVDLIEIEGGDVSQHRFGLAIDVGTTSVVVHLVDLVTGKTIDVASSYNAQAACGDDVITRIIYSQKADGLIRLQKLVIDTINRLIEEVSSKHRIDFQRIDSIVAAGNTTMTQLLLGIDPRYLRQDPYIPTANSFPMIRAAEVGLRVNSHASIYCMPCVSSYVGGDITAGVLRSEIYKQEPLTMFIDIGTNGEIVLGNKDWLVAASCSAGPAFEGGGVKCGMRATSGAIEQVRIDAATFEPTVRVIGQGKPVGICGSGIIDGLAQMLMAGIINRKGKIYTDLGHERIRVADGIPEYVLIWAKDSATETDIVLNEVDIDNVMRAKGAIYAGFRTLLIEVGLNFDVVERFLIAGGLGNFLNIESAVAIGLLPDIPQERFKYIGNSSVIGAYLALVSAELREESERIANSMTNMELSVSPAFMEEYLSALFLPHTDLSAFPSMREKLEQEYS
ncbi:MAG: DUF4445 domain-containing protein [Candidatus Schekmanbacteria bacterium]|nr:DUF4445 domain-containing protein [Candidatus Schekmanbacteria bacterium]